MAHADQSKVTEIAKELNARLQTGWSSPLPPTEEFKHLEHIALATGSKVYVGKISLAGQNSVESYYVQFNVEGGSSYSSVWPGWAFELAKLALLYGKRLLILANGDPFGSNLVQVLILAN